MKMIATKTTKRKNKGIEIISNNVGIIYLCYLLFDLFRWEANCDWSDEE